MSLIEEIISIETPSTRDLNWYYHGIPEETGAIKNILSEGIKCRNLLGKKGTGVNGKHFISLSKDIGIDESFSAFHGFRRCVMNIIIDNIKSCKCIDYLPFLHLLANTRLPIRSSGFADEFQAYRIIKPDKFVGIQCPLYYWTKGYEENGDYKYFLDAFKNLLIIMKLIETRLPLYDYSRLQGTSIHQINSDDFLTIYDGKIGELTCEEKRLLLKNND